MERMPQVKLIQTPVRIEYQKKKCSESLLCVGYHTGLGDKGSSLCLQGDFSLEGEMEKKTRPVFMGLNVCNEER